MQEILEHKFTKTDYKVKDGKPVVVEQESEMLFFNMRHKGHKIFEQLHGKPLMAVLGKVNVKDEQEAGINLMTNRKLIGDLICASWLKVDGDLIHNNLSTAKEMQKNPFFDVMTGDMEFIVSLMENVTNSLPKSKKGSSAPPRKKQ